MQHMYIGTYLSSPPVYLSMIVARYDGEPTVNLN